MNEAVFVSADAEAATAKMFKETGERKQSSYSIETTSSIQLCNGYLQLSCGHNAAGPTGRSNHTWRNRCLL